MSQPQAAINEKLIRDLPLLTRLSEADIKPLAALGRVRDYGAGETIFHQGEAGDALHVVVTGRVRVSIISSAGDETTVALVGAGDCVGELSLLDGRPRSATATASGPTRTFVVTRDAFTSWLKDRPTASIALLETLSLRLRRTDEALADLTFLDVSHRLARQLVRMATHAGADRKEVRITVTQSDLASMLGVSRESVNKQLNAFARQGWVQLARGAIILRDLRSLQSFD